MLVAIALVVFCASSAKAVEPEYSPELNGLTEIGGIFLEDAAIDGCWPNPKVTENLVIARLKAAGLTYGVTPLPERPEHPKNDDPDYDIKKVAYDDAMRARRAWWAKRLWIYVHGYDLGLEVGGRPAGVCVAYIELKLLTGEDRGHSLLGFLKSKDPERIQESILRLTDQFIADWVESNK